MNSQQLTVPARRELCVALMCLTLTCTCAYAFADDAFVTSGWQNAILMICERRGLHP